MAKKKYCFIIVNKENGEMYRSDGQLPIFWDKDQAKSSAKSCSSERYKYISHRIRLDKLNDLIIKTPITK